ncbi:MAG: cupin domain-containing protein [Dehalococcoidia bacterium]|nr:cupin domain-containing protein [Dehalococcoidia bacterium]MDP2662358.1 cupin domain-containing protein [Dehalococcoidia bacterium]
MSVFNLTREEEFSSDHYTPKFLHSSDKVRVLLLCLEAGQEVPPHTSPEATLYVVRGKGTITVGEEPVPVEAGTLIVVNAGVNHAVKSLERMALLVTVAAE